MQLQLAPPCDHFGPGVLAAAHPALDLALGILQASSVTETCCCSSLLCRGTVADAVVMDRKGYGFVTFADPKDAMTFLEVR